MKLTILRKGLILIAVPLLFQLGLIAIVGVIQSQSVEASQRVVHNKEVLAKSESLQATLIDLETGSRGYALTGDPVFTEPFDRARKIAPVEVRELKALVAGNPGQEARVDALAAKVSRLIEWHARLIQNVREGVPDKKELNCASRVKNRWMPSGKTSWRCARRKNGCKQRPCWIRLLTAMQGSLGLDLVRQHHPDLILLDVHLPDMRGMNSFAA